MKITIESKAENRLLNRQDIRFLVDHSGAPTPPRLEVRAKLAAMLNCPEDNLYIVELVGTYGKSVTRGYARLYSSKEAALAQEPKYIIERHKKPEAEEAEKTKEAEAPEKAKEAEAKAES